MDDSRRLKGVLLTTLGAALAETVAAPHVPYSGESESEAGFDSDEEAAADSDFLSDLAKLVGGTKFYMLSSTKGVLAFFPETPARPNPVANQVIHEMGHWNAYSLIDANSGGGWSERHVLTATMIEPGDRLACFQGGPVFILGGTLQGKEKSLSAETGGVITHKALVAWNANGLRGCLVESTTGQTSEHIVPDPNLWSPEDECRRIACLLRCTRNEFKFQRNDNFIAYYVPSPARPGSAETVMGRHLLAHFKWTARVATGSPILFLRVHSPEEDDLASCTKEDVDLITGVAADALKLAAYKGVIVDERPWVLHSDSPDDPPVVTWLPFKCENPLAAALTLLQHAASNTSLAGALREAMDDQALSCKKGGALDLVTNPATCVSFSVFK